MSEKQLPEALAGARVELTKPSSIAERWDAVLLSSDDATRPRAAAAALGLCWPRLRRRVPYKGDALSFGGAVIDTLVGKEGARYLDVYGWGLKALDLCADGLVPVEGAEGFSEPPGGEALGGR